MVDSNKESETAEASQDTQKSILVYGSDECSHCVNFKKKLDSAGYTYTFYDVDKDQSYADQMLLKLQQVGFRGNISLPVVVLEDDIKVGASFDEIESLL
ncbi:glutaredoxin [Catalinimonas alkaloidigena]|uniref:glutaredoxin family protein n=1 Tax=Catalinimonas alkaloidigena TaxID=1075417 RepID=UPI002405171F|nr:glutaredoxin family protein [Catalinimonas alkaloidigena]MDF9797052.1 glutaredoxin [Catalinimonas alkaloidigena]